MIRISVRELVAFGLRSGDLVSGGFASAARLHQGIRGHQQLQRARPPGYQAEVPIAHHLEVPPFCLEINGRIDGLMVDGDRIVLEEIKTTEGELTPDRPEEPGHWAQAKIYAYFVALQNGLERIDIQLTYVRLDPWEVREDRRTFSREELASFFADLVDRYLYWARRYYDWCAKRDSSIAALAFPFPEYRPGQEELIAAVSRAIAAQVRLFVQAPTGIGKTISVLFPAIQALGRGEVEKIFYLTAKTVGRTVAEKALDDLRQSGLRLKSLTLTARERICFYPRGSAVCDPAQCEYARGYFDRINGALEAIFPQDAFTRPTLEAIARQHQVCPFEFSLDLSWWADLIIGDYNYLFDPQVYLRRFFLEKGGRYVFLVDEAHNLVDRAREMFSADLYRSAISALRKAVAGDHPSLARELARIDRHLLALGRRCEPRGERDCWVDRELPHSLLPQLERFLEEAEKVLVRPLSAPYREELIDLYFQVFAFLRIAERFDEGYATYAEKSGRQVHLRLFCLDPSRPLGEALKRGIAAVFFSATLTPLEYFRYLLGGAEEDPLLSLDSPFPRANLHLLLADHLATTYRQRRETYEAVAEVIAAAVGQRQGNYLVYFPSHQYLREVAARFGAAYPEVEIVSQTPGMSEAERETFLARFEAEPAKTVVGFAVMGGIFGEGIDLVGERLVGAIIVGVGLPQLCLERDLICQYFDARGISGFDYAYTFPGMNRVMQAAGRVIRSAEDRGMVLLVDERFGQERYRSLFPPFWRPVHRVRTPAQIEASLELFWNGLQEPRYEPLYE